MSDLIKYPSDDEICQVAQDESQQDWSDHRYSSVYEEAFSDGAKWMRTEVSNVNSDKLYTQADMDKAIKAAKHEALDRLNDAFSARHGEDKITVGQVWDEVLKLKQQIEGE